MDDFKFEVCYLRFILVLYAPAQSLLLILLKFFSQDHARIPEVEWKINRKIIKMLQI